MLFEHYISFPNELSVFGICFLLLSSLLTSFISGAFGIGGGAISVGLLAIFLNPLYLIPVHGAVQIGSNFGRMMLMLRDVQKSPIIPFLIGSFIGSIFGGALFVQFPAWFIKLIVGMFILWTVFGRMPEIRSKYMIFGGIFSSFLTMFFGATGPFIASMVKTMKLAPLPHTATHSALMTIQHIIKVIVFGFIGFNFSDYVFLIIMMIFTGFIGTYLGRIILISYGQKYFKFLLNTLLTIISGHLIISGLTSSWI